MPEKKPTTNIYKKGYKKVKDSLTTNDDVLICEHCGVEINKGHKKCPNCQASLI